MASLLSPTADTFLRVGEPVQISWAISGAEDLRSTEVYVSRNSASGPFERIAAQEPADESLDWTVTGPLSTSAYFKLVARDSAGNVGVAISAQPLAIVAPLDVESSGIAVPAHPAIRKASPNPALGRIAIEYSLPSTQRVTITLDDLQGRRVATLFKGRSSRGVSRVNWEAERIAALPPAGMYFIQLNAETGSDVVRVVLAR